MAIEPNQDELLRQTYQLAKENNKMLHAMRRNAFLGVIIKLLIYAALIVIPLWFYMQYLAPVMQQMLKTVNEIQGTGARASAQMGDWQKTLQDLQDKIPGLTK